MKVERSSRSSVRGGVHPGTGFVKSGDPDEFVMSLLASDTALARRDMDRMFETVARLGDALVREQSLGAVRAYRQAVAQVVDAVVRRGLSVRDGIFNDRHGRQTQYLTVDEIDRRLLDMWQAIVEKQSDPLTMLRLVGEVKGLLMSLRI
ncbi:MAG: DUF327 family protein [Bacilli bacterium]